MTSKKKTGPGRPKLEKGIKKEPFYIRLNPDEISYIDERTAQEGISRAEYIRQLIQRDRLTNPL